MENQVAESQRSMLKEVLDGMRNFPKSLPSKYFYDKHGSDLFEQITRLEEYYPTRAEVAIINHNIHEIAGYIGNDSVIVELGSGSSKKKPDCCSTTFRVLPPMCPLIYRSNIWPRLFKS